MTGAVHLFYADRRTLDDDLTARHVTDDDRQRLTSAMGPHRRAEYLAGRALLRHALERCTRRAGTSFRIVVAADGKPACVDGPAISLAHSAEVVVCAVAPEGAIGVDVETRGPRGGLAGIAERYFTPDEAEWVTADAEARFRMLWVLKEAYLKALGVGLAGGLAALECRIEPPTIHARTREESAPQLKLWSGRRCHVGLAATGAPPLGVEISRWAPADEPDAVGPLVAIAATVP